MNKYPVLERISQIARAVGWIALFPTGLISLTGAANVLGVTSWGAAQGLNPWYGVAVFVFGGTMLLGSLMLIIIGELTRVFMDIEHNTFEVARAALSMAAPTPTPAQSASASVLRDRREAQLANRDPAPVINSGARSGDFAASSIVKDIIGLAREEGYEVKARNEYVVFTKGGRDETCYNVGHIRRFARVAKLVHRTAEPHGRSPSSL
jgi:hypothetical protein